MKFHLPFLLRIAFLVPIFLIWPMGVSAQNAAVTPEVQLMVDRTSLAPGETCRAILTIHNTTPYALTNVSAQFQGTAFSIASSTDLPNTLPPYSSAQSEYTLTSETDGLHNILFTVQYAWDDPDTGMIYHRIELAAAEGIEVIAPSRFDWPDYLIPLVVGFIIGQLGAWFTDWRKERKEIQERQEQARGVALAVLQSARKAVQEREQASFDLWEEAIVKGHLYPALHQLGRASGKPELSKRLAELSIGLADYNDRQPGRNFPKGFLDHLNQELTDLIRDLINQDK